MSDLISRQAVLDVIKQELDLRVSYDTDIALCSVKCRVLGLPVVYNIDKVVEEIRMNSAGPYRDMDGDWVSPTIETNQVIDIVKRGGVE